MENSLYKKLENCGKLPTPSAVVVRLLELSRNPDVSVRDVVDVLALDPALTAKVLRFVNSPLAGVGRKISSLHQAVALLGVRSVKMMALSFSVIEPNEAKSCLSFDPRQHAMQSLACGIAARRLSEALKINAPQEAFLAGLLSQMGRSALACALVDEYEPILQQAVQVPRDLPRLEQATLQGTYATVGAALLHDWGIPDLICDAIKAFRPLDGSAPEDTFAKLLFAAELTSSIVCPSNKTDPISPMCIIEFLQKEYGLEVDACEKLLCEVSDEIAEARNLFDLGGAHVVNAEDLTAFVRERITELTVAMHLENVDLTRQREDLMKRATTDPLTGIGNRAAFDDRLAAELERAVRHQRPITLLMIDLDHFKKLNDTHGHLAGDRVLQAVANVLDDNIRKIDFASRYGGEEFTVIAPETAEEGATYLAQRICDRMQALSLDWEGTPMVVTASIGVAVCLEPFDPKGATALIQAADEQLYAAKHAGRNCVKLRIIESPPKSNSTSNQPEPTPMATH